MGLIFRKSIKLGPFKLNISKHGIGYSIDGKRIRHTRTSTGKTYNTLKIFKGLSYRTKQK